MEGIMESFTGIVTPKPTALIAVANGTEEIELAALSNVLARGGVRVTIAHVDGDEDNVVTLAHGVEVQADRAIANCVDESYDVILAPGGRGAKTLGSSSELVDMIRKQKTAGRWFGAICAGPVDVLHRNALVTGPMTCFPSYADRVGSLYRDEPVVVSENCVTSQGPATAIAMALRLLALLRGDSVAHGVADSLM